MKGVYVLLMKLNNDTTITIGKLGTFLFKKGFYAYTGSALGTGGFRRVTRHFNVAKGENTTRRWHIDYLLHHLEVICAVTVPTGDDLECQLSTELAAVMCGIPGFGCSDCSCPSHLFFSDTDITGMVTNTCKNLTGNESIIISPPN
ncbi:MAG: GIY-YIG nuclease family protein [Candidatus Methanoperedenaceae archaeon]|nr:GIY-YIG nuclease family protein [Candidatus Methanoperedenaceae archaeon]